jgi:hypothetical protein
MAEPDLDPLRIINQNAAASAQFFQSMNAAVAQTAANEVNLARAASSIIDTTFKAKELKRVNTQNIASSILADRRADAQFAMTKQAFDFEMLFANEKAELNILKQRNDLLVQQQILANEKAQVARQRVSLEAGDLAHQAFSIFGSTGSFAPLREYSRLSGLAMSGVLRGADADETVKNMRNEFKKFTSNITLTREEYSPANTQLIAEVISPAAAENYDLLNNPNKQAAYSSLLTSFITGTPDTRRKLESAPIKPEDRQRVIKGISEYDSDTDEIKRLIKLKAEFQDPLTGAFGQNNENKVRDPVTGNEIEVRSFSLEAKSAQVRNLDARINSRLAHREAVLNAVRTGVEIPDFEELGASPTFEETGSQGQSGSNVQPIPTAKPTAEQLARIRTEQVLKTEEFKTPQQALNRLSEVGSVTESDKLNVVISDLAESHGIPRIVSGIQVGKVFSEINVARQIKSNLDNLTQEEFERTFFSEGQIVDMIAKRRKIPTKVDEPESGLSNKAEIDRAKLLKRFAKENKIRKGDTAEDLKLAFAEALAEEISERLK